MGPNGDAKRGQHATSKSVIESLVSGSISSSFTTVMYQPLELLKTRIQIRDKSLAKRRDKPLKVLGRVSQSAIILIRNEGITYLWRGTGASLLRSGPGVGLYYALLNVMQANLSGQEHKPDNPGQAFLFGLTARSLVSFVLLPITVVKVRYESGKYSYHSLGGAIKDAYLRNGWVGVAPTILRDSLFSGTYYMCYTKLKADNGFEKGANSIHLRNFSYGVISGLVASVVTNPIDVLKTNIQVAEKKDISMKQIVVEFMNQKRGLTRFFDGLVPRSLRRTLIAATTWTFYELIRDTLR